MPPDADPTNRTDEQREYFADGWNECLKLQPGFLTALRRIVSLDPKNVPKYAQQIAREAADRQFNEGLQTMKIEMGVGWKPDPSGGWVSCTPEDYVAAIKRLRALLIEIRDAMENDYGWGSTIEAIEAELAIVPQQETKDSKP